MLINQLLVLPSTDTLAYLSRVFGGCPFDLDLTKCYVEINSSQYEMEPEPARLYRAHAGTMKEYFDTASQSSALILPLDCQPLVERAHDVRMRGAPSAFYGDHYFPHMIVKTHMPPRYPSLRAFVNSVSNTLATTEDHPLLFEGEFIVQQEFHAIPQADYYATMVADKSGSRSKAEPGLVHWMDPRNVRK
jgi:hypothetical protein